MISPESQRMIEVYKARGKEHKGYAKCLCSAGRSSGKCPSAFHGFELWSVMWDESASGNIPREDYRNIIDTLTELRGNRNLLKAGNLIECLNPNLLAPTRTPTVTAPPTPVTPTPVKPSTLPKVAIKKPKLAHGIGAYWDVAFENTIEEETQEMWDTTEAEGIETQTALCLEGDTITVLKDQDNKPVFIKGEKGQVEAFARKLKCPPNSIKVGTLHTHPPKTQEELAKDIPSVEVEMTHEQSVTDLDVLLQSEEILSCTRTKQSVTCFANTTATNPRVLFKDVMKRATTGRRGFFGLQIDKQKFKGALITRGIRKFKKPFVGITTNTSVICLDTVNGDASTVCWEHHDLPPVVETRDVVTSIEKQLKEARAEGKPVLSTKKGTSGLHATGVETQMLKFSKINGNHKRIITLKPYTTNWIFCSEGFDKKIWCDGMQTLGEIRLHKELLAPRFEQAIWDAMYERLDQDFTTTAMWALMTNYVNVLGISSTDEDVRKRARLRGIMKDYEARKDNNYFVRQMLPLIQLE